MKMSIDMTTRRRVISVESIRRANDNLISGRSSLDTNNLPEYVKQEIRRRHYSAEEINAAYARAVTRVAG